MITCVSYYRNKMLIASIIYILWRMHGNEFTRGYSFEIDDIPIKTALG